MKHLAIFVKVLTSLMIIFAIATGTPLLAFWSY